MTTDKSNNSVEITPEKEINSELSRINLGIEAIKLLKEKYGSLELTDLDDKVTLKQIHDGRMEVVRARTGIEKFCKSKRDFANDYIRENRAIETGLIKLLTPLEAKLKAEEEKPEKEKERLRIEQEREELQRNTHRTAELISNGMAFNPITNIYSIAEIQLSEAELKNISDTQFDELLLTVKAENEKQIEVRRKDAADALALAQENARVKKEQDDIAQKQKEEREKIDSDLAEIKKQQRDIRRNLLSSIGMSSQLNGYEYKSIRIAWEEIESLDATAFNKEIEMLKGRIAALKISEKAAEEKRITDLAEQKAKDEQLRKENEEKERLRIAALAPDKEKLLAFAKLISELPAPDFSTEVGSQVFDRANNMLTDTIEYIKHETLNFN